MEAPSLLDEALRFRAARRRSKTPQALRRVVARARLDAEGGPRPATAAERRSARKVREDAEMERLFSHVKSAPRITSFRNLVSASTKKTEALEGRRWSTHFETRLGTTQVLSKSTSALPVDLADPAGCDADWVAGVVGEETTGFLESGAQRRVLHAALSKPEALESRPPGGGFDEDVYVAPSSGYRAAGLAKQRVARLDARGDVTSLFTDALLVLEDVPKPARRRGPVPRLDLRMVQGADLDRIMPLLRPRNRERFAELEEPIRDRDKNWRLDSVRRAWALPARRHRLGRYPPKNAPCALWNGTQGSRAGYVPSIGCYAATDVLERGCYIISRSYCYLTLLGIGFAGRVYVPSSASSSVTRELKVRLYVQEFCETCEMSLRRDDLDALFALRDDTDVLFKPGNRTAFVRALRSQMYLTYRIIECWWTSKRAPKGAALPATAKRAFNECEATSPFLAGRRVTTYEDLAAWHTSPEKVQLGVENDVERGRVLRYLPSPVSRSKRGLFGSFLETECSFLLRRSREV